MAEFKFTLDFILKNTGATILQKSTDSELIDEQYLDVGFDTRKNLQGQLFIALKGEQYDAHNFLDQAIDKGACALLIHSHEKLPIDKIKNITILKVKDTLLALQSLARAHRQKMPAKILAITGSNGKTSTKEFTAAILAQENKVHYSVGSYNNHWGVPFTLLALRPEHQVGVIELGMNHFGELTQLMNICLPDVVTCTMVGRAHIEFFGSIEKIAQAKEEVYLSASDKCVRIFNIDNPFTLKMRENYLAQQLGSKRYFSFSNQNKKADVFIEIEELGLESLIIRGHILNEKFHGVRVAVFGFQNAVNLAAAAALALSYGMSPQKIISGLSVCKSAWGRNQLMKLSGGGDLVFDAYNANLDSMLALLSNIEKIPRKFKIGVFGQMLELGDLSEKMHEELGIAVRQANFNLVFFIGKDFRSFKKGLGTNINSFVSESFNPNLGDELAKSYEQNQGALVCMKASRGTRLERFLEYLGIKSSK